MKNTGFSRGETINSNREHRNPPYKHTLEKALSYKAKLYRLQSNCVGWLAWIGTLSNHSKCKCENFKGTK